jgi:hypothetical protein
MFVHSTQGYELCVLFQFFPRHLNFPWKITKRKMPEINSGYYRLQSFGWLLILKRFPRSGARGIALRALPAGSYGNSIFGFP